MVMGLSGFALATMTMERVTGYFLGSGVITFLSLAVFSGLTILYGMKWFRFPGLVRAEFDDPVNLHFFPAYSISLLLLATSFLGISQNLSIFFWTVGTFVHLVLTFAIVSIWIRNDKFHPDHLNPSWFIPIVGNLLVPIAGMNIFPGSYLWFFFGVGFIFWIMLLTLFLDRAIFHKALPEKLIPTFFIMIAPPAVGVVSYVRMTGSMNEFAYILYFFALFLALLFLGNAPMFTKIRFSLSWWAFSFPISALSIASAIVFLRTGEDYFRSLTIIIYLILVAVIVNLLLRTASHVRRWDIRIGKD
jgi:tellurite resistance protein